MKDDVEWRYTASRDAKHHFSMQRPKVLEDKTVLIVNGTIGCQFVSGLIKRVTKKPLQI